MCNRLAENIDARRHMARCPLSGVGGPVLGWPHVARLRFARNRREEGPTRQTARPYGESAIRSNADGEGNCKSHGSEIELTTHYCPLGDSVRRLLPEQTLALIVMSTLPDFPVFGEVECLSCR